MNILIVEYLHADQNAFRSASASMRAEGRAMLLALADDAAKLPRTRVTVACCEEAADLPLPKNMKSLVVSALSPSDLAEEISLADEFWDWVLPVAPESDGILLQFVQALRDGGARVLTGSSAALQTCADKWLTCQLLCKRDLPTIPTMLLSELSGTSLPNVRWPSEAVEFVATVSEGHCTETRICVVKPRDGAGCEGIRRVPMAAAKRLALESARDAESLIVQPWLDADSFSIAVIGRGAGQTPDVLPLATQKIEWRGDGPVYLGGTILPQLPAGITTDVVQLCEAIVNALDFRAGYLGIDLLLPRGSGELLVTEINPRICTSYIGYRQAAKSNLLACLLNQETPERLSWMPQIVEFTCRDQS